MRTERAVSKGSAEMAACPSGSPTPPAQSPGSAGRQACVLGAARRGSGRAPGPPWKCCKYSTPGIREPRAENKPVRIHIHLSGPGAAACLGGIPITPFLEPRHTHSSWLAGVQARNSWPGCRVRGQTQPRLPVPGAASDSTLCVADQFVALLQNIPNPKPGPAAASPSPLPGRVMVTLP